LLPLVTGLTACASARGRLLWTAFDGWRVGGGRPGGVGGVLAQPVLQLVDLLRERVDLGPKLLCLRLQRQDQGLRRGR
jgi:hypothetical protein